MSNDLQDLLKRAPIGPGPRREVLRLLASIQSLDLTAPIGPGPRRRLLRLLKSLKAFLDRQLDRQIRALEKSLRAGSAKRVSRRKTARKRTAPG
jgi:hypothetical protein